MNTYYRYTPRTLSIASLLAAIVLTQAFRMPCSAYEFFGPNQFTFTKWQPGLNSAEFHAGDKMSPPMSPGGASWSAMPSGVPLVDELRAIEEFPVGPHPQNVMSVDFDSLIPTGAAGLELSIINDALNVWAAAADFTNLGMVADSGAESGASEANNGHVGDIRVAAYPNVTFGPFSEELAHGYAPCTETLCSIYNGFGTVFGDIHFNTNILWADDPTDVEGDVNGSGVDDFDLFTVALHEIGHALGLGHSDVPESVMFNDYSGARRTLHSDDIAGIQAIYGPPPVVPEPGSLALAAFGLLSLLGRRRRGR